MIEFNQTKSPLRKQVVKSRFLTDNGRTFAVQITSDCSVRSFSIHQHLIAFMSLMVYLFLGFITPEAASALVLQQQGPHEITMVESSTGQMELVLHHHHVQLGQSDFLFHQRHRVEPDHKFRLPATPPKADSVKPCRLVNLANPDILNVPVPETLHISNFPETQVLQTLPQPPPALPKAIRIRRTIVLQV